MKSGETSCPTFSSLYSGIQTTTRAHLKGYPICCPPRFFESGKLKHLNHLQKKTQLPPPNRATCSIIIIPCMQSGDSKSQCMSTKLIVANLDKNVLHSFLLCLYNTSSIAELPASHAGYPPKLNQSCSGPCHLN
jgi:hypothetical protein